MDVFVTDAIGLVATQLTAMFGFTPASALVFESICMLAMILVLATCVVRVGNVINPKRLQLVCKRWCWLACYSCLGVLVCQLVLSLIDPLRLNIDVFSRYFLTIATLSYVAWFYGLQVLGIWQLNRALRLNWDYPPITLAVWPGFIWLFVQLSQISVEELHANLYELRVYILVPTFVLVVAVGLKWLYRRSRRNTTLAASRPAAITEWTAETLRDWISNEKPIVDQEALIFDRAVYVNRIFKVLTQNTESAKRIALCGEYGSGKSSITRMVEKCLKSHEQRWMVVYIDAWGRQQDTLDQHILERIIEELAKHADMFAFKGLPKEYHQALKTATSWGEAVINVLSGASKSSSDILKKLNNLLCQLDFRLLLVIEDPDRDLESKKICKNLASLLDRLDPLDVNHINFILAFGIANEDADALNRICEIKECLQPVDGQAVVQKCLELLWNPALEGKFNPNAPLEICPDISNLVRNPRVLKSICRQVDLAWKNLVGEIYLGDLIVMTAIQEWSPYTLGLVVNDVNRHNATKNSKALALDSLTQLNEFSREARIALGTSVNFLPEIKVIYPPEADSRHSDEEVYTRREYQNCQRIFQWEAGDKYLQNFLLKALVAEDSSDQKSYASFVNFRRAILAQNVSGAEIEYFCKITNSVAEAELFLLMDKSYLPGAPFRYSRSCGADNQLKLLSALLVFIKNQKSLGRYKSSLDAIDVMLDECCLDLNESEQMEHIKAALSVDLAYALTAMKKFIKENDHILIEKVIEALDVLAQTDQLGFSLAPLESGGLRLIGLFKGVRPDFFSLWFVKLLLKNYALTANKEVGAQLLVLIEQTFHPDLLWRADYFSKLRDFVSDALPILQKMKTEFVQSEFDPSILERIDRVVLELQGFSVSDAIS